MGQTKSHRRFVNVLRSANCIAALLLVASCDGNSPDPATQTEEAQGVLGTHVDFRTRGAVLTSRNDNSRTGANLAEVDLKPSNVQVSTFGLRYTRNLDGKVYAQPLFVPDVLTFHLE